MTAGRAKPPKAERRGFWAWFGEHGAGWISAVMATLTFLVGGAGAVVGYQARPHLDPAPTITVTATPGSTPGPSSTGSVLPTGVDCPDGALPGELAPDEQRGWEQTWTGCRTIDTVGVVFTDDRPQSSTGDEYDIAYRADQDGWQTEGLTRWFPRRSAPGPASCRKLLVDGTGADMSGTKAQPGQAGCWDEATNSGLREVFLQVYSIGPEAVTVRIWE